MPMSKDWSGKKIEDGWNYKEDAIQAPGMRLRVSKEKEGQCERYELLLRNLPLAPTLALPTLVIKKYDNGDWITAVAEWRY